jgi:hypothetical protein
VTFQIIFYGSQAFKHLNKYTDKIEVLDKNRPASHHKIYSLITINSSVRNNKQEMVIGPRRDPRPKD